MYSYLALYLRDPVSVPVYSWQGEDAGQVVLPDVFRVPVRKDLIRRVYLSEFTAKLQPKGRDPLAGKRTSARSLGAHHGVSRVPRIRNSMRAALVNMTRGGRLAHPPRVEKKIHERVNKKERILGTMSALAATSMPEFVRARGHVFNTEYLPVIVESEVEEKVTTVKQALELLEKLGLAPDIARAKEKTRWRAGKGKMRGRRYKKPKSILFIVEDHRSPFARAVKGLPGTDIATPESLNVLVLAPGGEPGRLTLITSNALKALGEKYKVI
ncbi:MAG: 50S ribosomal protein L4 [Desulfurococcales archaeon]|nr:50S ribosomal protein L4 [Desulfurococcales archaeon]